MYQKCSQNGAQMPPKMGPGIEPRTRYAPQKSTPELRRRPWELQSLIFDLPGLILVVQGLILEVQGPILELKMMIFRSPEIHVINFFW